MKKKDDTKLEKLSNELVARITLVNSEYFNLQNDLKQWKLDFERMVKEQLVIDKKVKENFVSISFKYTSICVPPSSLILLLNHVLSELEILQKTTEKEIRWSINLTNSVLTYDGIVNCFENSRGLSLTNCVVVKRLEIHDKKFNFYATNCFFNELVVKNDLYDCTCNLHNCLYNHINIRRFFDIVITKLTYWEFITSTSPLIADGITADISIDSKNVHISRSNILFALMNLEIGCSLEESYVKMIKYFKVKYISFDCSIVKSIIVNHIDVEKFIAKDSSYIESADMSNSYIKFCDFREAIINQVFCETLKFDIVYLYTDIYKITFYHELYEENDLSLLYHMAYSRAREYMLNEVTSKYRVITRRIIDLDYKKKGSILLSKAFKRDPIINVSHSISNCVKSKLGYLSYRLSSYGEKPFRIFILSAFFIFVFAVLYMHQNEVANNIEFISSFDECLYFSFITFTTLGYGDLHPTGITRFIAAIEAVLGVALMGYFLALLVRKQTI